jgi:hypothetical protein
MKKVNLLFLGLVAMVAMSVGFSSCGKDDGGDDDDGGGNGKQGYLTVTGLSEHNGKWINAYVHVEESSDVLGVSGHEKIVGDVLYFVKIADGQAKLPLFGQVSLYKYEPYTGNDKGAWVEIEIYDVPTDERLAIRPIAESDFNDIDFTDGNATLKWVSRESAFVGAWRRKNEGQTDVLTLKSDKTYTYDKGNVYSPLDCKPSGDWKVLDRPYGLGLYLGEEEYRTSVSELSNDDSGFKFRLYIGNKDFTNKNSAA